MNRFFLSFQPLAKEYRDYSNTIDKVNDLGNAYDALLRGERPDSPSRRRSSAVSPTKRTSVSSPCKTIVYIYILNIAWSLVFPYCN